MANVQTAQDVAQAQDGAIYNNQTSARNTSKASARNWRWHDPPILFPMFLIVLIIAYAVLRTQ